MLTSEDPPSYTLENFPLLPGSTPTLTNPPPSSPWDFLSFMDPSLLKSLDIFSDKSPISPLTIPLDSIRFENLTIRKSSKAKPYDASGPLGLYTPLLARIKAAARSLNSPQALRTLSPKSQVNPCELSPSTFVVSWGSPKENPSSPSSILSIPTLYWFRKLCVITSLPYSTSPS